VTLEALAARLDPARLARLAVWLLAGVCVLLALRIAVIVLDGPEVTFEPIPVTPVAELPTEVGSVDWRLFGTATEADYGFDRALPATPLTLRLRGVVTGPRGYAIIVDEQGNEGVYRIEDELPGQARVVGIEPRRVVLERDGRREALELPGQGEARRPAARSETAGTATDGGYPASAGIGSLSGITSQFSLDPEALARRITILPVAGGGFRVRAGRDAEIFTRLGFHANDVVVAINGQRVDNQAGVRAVFEDWDPAQPVAITVRRGDRQVVLTPGR